MPVEISAEIEIAASPADIAGVMFDPSREPEWVKAVSDVELLDPALERGARVKRVGSFMGQPLEWVTEVETVHFPHVLTLRIVNGPFTGTLRYEIQRSNGGSRVRIRGTGDITRPVLAPAALIAEPMRAALAADLDRLRQLIEAGR